jgi:hypothetical protein
MEPVIWRGIPHFEEASHHCTCIGSTLHWPAVWHVLWCIRHRHWRCIEARWSCNCLCFMIAAVPWRAWPHSWPGALDHCSCIKSLEALSLGQSSAHLHRSQESEVPIHSVWLEHETTKMAQANQGLWVGSSLPSWKGQRSCGRSKLQASMQPSLRPVSPFLLWPRRAESLSGSTWQPKQHSPYSNHQRRCLRCLEDGH